MNNVQHEKFVLAACGACRLGVIFKLSLREQTAEAILANLFGDQKTLGMAIIDQWPRSLEVTAPEGVPSSVNRYFQQAVDSLRAQNFDAAGVMFRKSLDVATKEKAPTKAAKTLVKRIEALAEDGLITNDMREWAHEIRLGGNDAAHEDEPFDATDAERIYKFTDAFLRYAYTLPALVTASKTPVEESSE